MAANKPATGSEAAAGRPPAGAEAPLVDYQKKQKQSETVFWVSSVGSILLVLGILYYVYASILTPKAQKITSLSGQINQERTKRDTYEKERKALPELKELNEVIQAKWTPVVDKDKSIWFFKDYWEVIDHIGEMGDVCAANGVFCPIIKFQIFEGLPTNFPVDWSTEKIRQRIEQWVAGNIDHINIGTQEMGYQCANLLCPLGFEADLYGEYPRLMDTLNGLNYDAVYLYSIRTVKMSKVSQLTTFLTFTPIGTVEDMKVTGAAWFLNPSGTPNTDFLQAAAGSVAGGGGGGGGAGGGGKRGSMIGGGST